MDLAGIAQTGRNAVDRQVDAAAHALVGGVVGLHPSPPQISASDIQSARERMTLKEHLIRELDNTTVRTVQQVPRGLELAKDAR